MPHNKPETYNVTYLADGDISTKTDTFCGTVQQICDEVSKFGVIHNMWKHGEQQQEMTDEEDDFNDEISQGLAHGFSLRDIMGAMDHEDECGDR